MVRMWATSTDMQPARAAARASTGDGPATPALSIVRPKVFTVSVIVLLSRKLPALSAARMRLLLRVIVPVRVGLWPLLLLVVDSFRAPAPAEEGP